MNHVIAFDDRIGWRVTCPAHSSPATRTCFLLFHGIHHHFPIPFKLHFLFLLFSSFFFLFFLPISLSTVRNEFSFLFFFENSTRSTWLKFHPSCHKLINLRWINNRSITISPLSWRNNSDDNHWLAYQQRQSLVTMPWLRNEILSGFRWQFSGISTESWKNPKKVTHGQKPSGAPPPPISPPCPPPPPPPPSPEPHFNI